MLIRVRLKNSDFSYGQIGRMLHWSSVGVLLASVVSANSMSSSTNGVSKVDLITRHASFGILLLVLMLLRFAWRLNNVNPVHSYTIAAWQRRTAISIHWFLYVMVIIQCCLGIAQIIAKGAAITVFDTILIEASGIRSVEICELMHDLHVRMADLIYLAVFIHLGAAIYHQIFGVVDDDDGECGTLGGH